MKNGFLKSVFVGAILICSHSLLGQDLVLALVCEADKFQTYNATKVDGEYTAYGFVDDNYSSPFTFDFRVDKNSGAILTFIDGEPTKPQTASIHANIIYFQNVALNDTSISAWQYVLNLDTGKLIGSQVNGFNVEMLGIKSQGVKARSVPFSCVALDD